MGALTDKQERFVLAYIGDANYNATEAARRAGYSSARASGTENLANPIIKARIHEHLEEVRQHGIANKAVRIAELNDLNDRMKLIMDSRVREAKNRYEQGEEVPESAESGLMVETIKTVGVGQNQSVTHEWSFDKGLHDAILKTKDQAAKEVGDRDKKIEMSGPNGGPIHVTSGKTKLLELAADDDDEQES